MEFSIPKLVDLFQNANFTYDLINSKNWKSSLSEVNTFITSYLNTRQVTGTFTGTNLLEYNYPTEGKSMNVFKTISSSVVNENFYEEIKEVIVNKYDHGPIAAIGPGSEKFNLTQIGILPDKILSYLEELINVDKTLTNNLKKVSTDVQFQVEFVMNKDNKGKKYAVKNTNLARIGLQPEIIGYDISKNMIQDTKKTVSFVSSSLFSYNYTSPQVGTIGSVGNLASIIMDIIDKNLNPTSSGNPTKNISDIIIESNAHYNYLVHESNLIDTTDSDLFSIKQIGDKINLPKAYGAWCTYNAINTSIYNYTKDSSKISIDLEKHFSYTVTLRIGTPNTYDFLKSRAEPIKFSKLNFINILRKVITVFPEDDITKLGNDSIDNVLSNYFDKMTDTDISNLLTHGINCLLFNMILIANQPWRTTTLPPASYTINKEQVVKYANDEFSKMTEILYRNLGNIPTRPMGGTLLTGEQSFSWTKNNRKISSSTDVDILTNVSNFIDEFLSDTVTIKKEIRVALENLKTKFWKRDVIFWLEVVIKIFNPFLPPRTYSDSYLETAFAKIEMIMKELHNKQIKIMNDYINKIESLKQRVNKTENFEKEQNIYALRKDISINYIKRQLYIVDYILNVSLKTRWVSGTPALFNEDKFKRLLIYVDRESNGFFTKEVTKLLSKTKDVALKSEINNLRLKLTPNVGPRNKVRVSKMHEDLPENINNEQFWFLVSANLKNIKDDANKNSLYNFYIPVYMDTFYGSREFYLLDLMHLLIKGGIKTIKIKDLKNKKFSCDEKALVVSGKTENIKTNIKAINYEWFEKLYNTVNLIDDKDRRFYFIRVAIYYLFDEHDNFYENDKVLKKEPIDASDLKILESFELLSDSEKYKKKKCLSLIDIDTISFMLKNVEKRFSF